MSCFEGLALRTGLTATGQFQRYRTPEIKDCSTRKRGLERTVRLNYLFPRQGAWKGKNIAL